VRQPMEGFKEQESTPKEMEKLLWTTYKHKISKRMILIYKINKLIKNVKLGRFDFVFPNNQC